MNVPFKRIILALGVLAIASFGSAAARAHGGEDHGDDANAPTPAGAVVPRAVAQSEDFELVAVLDESKPEDRRLSLFLDRFATNAPVVGAKLEVDGGEQNVIAKETSPGVYVATLGGSASAAPGSRLPLTIAIETDDAADLLTTTLDIPAPADMPAAHVRGRGWTAIWIGGGVLVLATLMLLIVGRRRQPKGAA